MTLTSRMTAALDKQLEADKQFEAEIEAISDPPSTPLLLTPAQPLEADKQCEAKTEAILEPPSTAPSTNSAPPIEAEKQLEAKTPKRHRSRTKKNKGLLDPSSSPLSPPAAISPPTVPQVFEDRYAKGWADAWELIRPQLHELHRRDILIGTRLSSANRWMKWLPIICFCCTLFGFALGWCYATFAPSRPWDTAQKSEVTPKVVGDRGDKIMR